VPISSISDSINRNSKIDPISAPFTNRVINNILSHSEEWRLYGVLGVFKTQLSAVVEESTSRKSALREGTQNQ
jgi:hypothetical protein